MLITVQKPLLKVTLQGILLTFGMLMIRLSLRENEVMPWTAMVPVLLLCIVIPVMIRLVGALR